MLSIVVALTALAPRELRAQSHAPPAAVPAFDPAAVVARARRSFHPEGAALIARGRAHVLESRGGRVALLPRVAAGRAGVTFETRSVARGDRSLPSHNTSARVAGDGGLDLERNGVREHWLNDERSAEQSWYFPALPSGRGELRVRVAIHGARFVASTGEGLRFDAAGAPVRYGVGTWIDARGARFTVRPAYERGEVVLVVPADVLERSAFPAVLDPTISAEFPLDAPVPNAAVDHTNDNSLAFDGTNYLLVWADNPAPVHLPDEGVAVYATRIAPTGQVRDPAGFVVAPSTPGSVRSSTAVAATSTGALVVWRDTTATPAGLYARAVGPAGVPLGAAPVLISTSCCTSRPALATDGTNYLLVWSQGGDVLALRLRPDGTALDAAPFTVGATPDPETNPGVAFHAPDYLVAWERLPASGLSKVYAARVSAAGAVLDATPIRLSGAVERQAAPAVAAGPAGFLVAWGDRRNAADFDLYATRIDGSGAVLDASGILLAGGSGDQQLPAATFDGTNYVVTYQTGISVMGYPAQTISVARVSAAGVVLGTTQLSTGGFRQDQYDAHPACAAVGCLVSMQWQISTILGPISQRTTGVRLDPLGARLDPLNGVPLATIANTQIFPSVASDGTNFLVVWRDNRAAPVGSDGAIWGARVDPRGAILDPGGIHVAEPIVSSSGASVAFDGTNYLVVWKEVAPLGALGASGIYGARVAPSGALVDATPVRLFTPTSTSQLGSAPVVGARAGLSLVAWGHAFPPTVLAVRVDASAHPLETVPIEFGQSTAMGGTTVGDVASDGTDFFLTWLDSRGGTPQTYGGRVSAAGVALDGTGIRLIATAHAQTSGAVTFGAGQYFVALVDTPDTIGGGSLIGARVSTAGAVLDTDGIALGRARATSLAFDGTNYALVSTGGAAPTVQWISPAGTVAAGPVDGAPGSESWSNAEVCTNSSGALLTAYSRRVPDPPYRTTRVFARVLSSADGGVLVDAGTDAATDAADSSAPADSATDGNAVDASADIALDTSSDVADSSALGDVAMDTAADSAGDAPMSDGGSDAATDGSPGVDGGGEPAGASYCGCRTPGGAGRSAWALPLVGLALALARFRSRRRRRAR